MREIAEHDGTHYSLTPFRLNVWQTRFQRQDYHAHSQWPHSCICNQAPVQRSSSSRTPTYHHSICRCRQSSHGYLKHSRPPHRVGREVRRLPQESRPLPQLLSQTIHHPPRLHHRLTDTSTRQIVFEAIIPPSHSPATGSGSSTISPSKKFPALIVT